MQVILAWRGGSDGGVQVREISRSAPSVCAGQRHGESVTVSARSGLNDGG